MQLIRVALHLHPPLGGGGTGFSYSDATLMRICPWVT